jgi:hypothetical protein
VNTSAWINESCPGRFSTHDSRLTNHDSRLKRQTVQASTEYLVSYGKSGEFGRFTAVEPLACRRGDALVIETNRGLEWGQVIRSADPEHARLLGGGPAGRIVRQPDEVDRQVRERLKQQGQKVFLESRARALRLGLPMEILDAEILLDGREAVLHVLRWGDAELHELTDALARTHGLHTVVHDLAVPASKDEPEVISGVEHGCGSGGCGSGGCGSGGCSSGGCGSCSSGGCSSSSESHHHPAERPQSISLL